MEHTDQEESSNALCDNRLLSNIDLQLTSETARMLSDTKLAILSLNKKRDTLLQEKAFADSCLHLEAIANIKMSGKQVSVRDVFRTVAIHSEQKTSDDDQSKQESLRNSEALLTACTLGRHQVKRDTFYEIHCQLLNGTTRDSYKGLLRTSDKYVGGGRYHEFGAPYHAPNPDNIPMLLDDLAVFCNQTDVPAVAQAALAHVQFLAIHPFERANGKTARAIIPLVFQRRGLIARTITPLSVAMVTSSHDYQKGVILTINNFLKENPDQQELNAWLQFFCVCCTRAVDEALTLEQNMSALQTKWIEQLNTRSDSATTLLIHALPGIPVFTTASAGNYTDRSFRRAAGAVKELSDAGIIVQVNEGKRNRVFECPEIVDSYAHIRGFQ